MCILSFASSVDNIMAFMNVMHEVVKAGNVASRRSLTTTASRDEEGSSFWNEK